MSDSEYTRTYHVPKWRIIETLAWLADGKTAKQVAAEMGIGLQSVYVYSTWGVRLLGAKTLAHACALLAMSDNLALDLCDVERVKSVMREIADSAAHRRKARK